MVADENRGELYYPTTDTTFDMGKVTDEDVSFNANVSRAAIPLTSANNPILESIRGKIRVLTIEGHKHGTQAELETFLKQFTDVMDVDGFIQIINYYPLFHHDNTLAATNKQDAFYIGLINNFSYRVTVDDAGFLMIYEFEFFEGIRVKDYIA